MNEKMVCLLMIHFQVTDKDFLTKLTEIEKTNRKANHEIIIIKIIIIITITKITIIKIINWRI